MNLKTCFNYLPSIALLLAMGCSQQPDGAATDQPADTQQLASTSVTTPADNADNAMDVYKSPSCGCCVDWIDHAEQRGCSFTTHHPVDFGQFKADKGIAPRYQSCHTAVSAEGYLFEGHVPARYVKQFLAAPPAGALGLAVPAMPVGTPGMEMGDRFSPYAVLLLKVDGSAELFAQVDSPAQQYQ